MSGVRQGSYQLGITAPAADATKKLATAEFVSLFSLRGDITQAWTAAYQAQGRSNLGLGSIATQAASAVAITGGLIDNTPIGVSTSRDGNFNVLTFGGNSANIGGGTSSAAFESVIGQLTGTARSGFAWNMSGGSGETNLLVNRGGGSQGGIAFSDVENNGVVNDLFYANTTTFTVNVSATFNGTASFAGTVTTPKLVMGTANVGTSGGIDRIDLFGNQYGFGISPSSLDYVSGGQHTFFLAGTLLGEITSTGLNAMAIGATTPSTATVTGLSVTGSAIGGFGAGWSSSSDISIGGTAISGAGSGRLAFRFDTTNNTAYIGAIAPALSWYPVVMEFYSYSFVSQGTGTTALTLDVNGNATFGAGVSAPGFVTTADGSDSILAVRHTGSGTHDVGWRFDGSALYLMRTPAGVGQGWDSSRPLIYDAVNNTLNVCNAGESFLVGGPATFAAAAAFSVGATFGGTATFNFAATFAANAYAQKTPPAGDSSTLIPNTAWVGANTAALDSTGMVPLAKLRCRRAQFLNAVESQASGNVQTIINTLPANPGDPVSLAYWHEPTVEVGGKLYTFIMSTLGLTTTQMATIMTNAASVAN